MRIVVSLGLVVLLFVADLAGQGRRGSRRSEPVELKHFTYELVTFDAPNLDGAKGEFGIYLPIGYEPDGERCYPWVLWLHGMNEDAGRFRDGGGAKELDMLRGEERIPEFVLVAPSAPSRTIYANGERAGNVERYILEDVTKYVEEHYRVATERAGRAIMGVSMGGMAALRLALKSPDRYATVAVHSAAAFPPDPTVLSGASAERVKRSVQWLGLSDLLGDPIDPEKWAQYIPSAMVKDIEPASLKKLRVYFDAGTEDRYGFGPPNEEFHELLEERKIEHSFWLVDGGGHSWGSGSMGDRLEKSFLFVAEGFPKPRAAEDGASEGANEGVR